MENNEKILTITEMTKEHFANYPQQPKDSINEYLKKGPLDKSNVIRIKERFKKDPKYYKQFQEAILHTSFMIMVSVQKTLNPETKFDFEKYTREFLFCARQDDKDIYDMRLYYMNSLNSDEMEIGTLDPEELNEIEDPLEKDLVLKEASNRKEFYDKLLNNLKTQYSESKIHLLG